MKRLFFELVVFSFLILSFNILGFENDGNFQQNQQNQGYNNIPYNPQQIQYYPQNVPSQFLQLPQVVYPNAPILPRNPSVITSSSKKNTMEANEFYKINLIDKSSPDNPLVQPVNKNWSMKIVKEMVEASKDITIEKMYFNSDEPLDLKDTLADCGIIEDSDIIYEAIHFKVILVNTAQGNSESNIWLASSDISVKKLKEAIQEQKGFAVETLRLIYGGKQLQNNKKLSDYNIKKDSKIISVFRVRGGL